MKKDVIYIKPEEDIAKVIHHLENSDFDIIALIPPKNLDVFLSLINLKLIDKTADKQNKKVVIVTADAGLTKLALSAGLPVAKDLKSRPVIAEKSKGTTKKEITKPKLDDSQNEPIDSMQINDFSKSDEDETSDQKDDIDDVLEEAKSDHQHEHQEANEDSKKNIKKINVSTPELKSKDRKLPLGFFKKYRLFIAASAIIIVLFSGFIFWALAIAPSVTIDVSIRTLTNNFSENIELTSDGQKQDLAKSVLFMEEHRYEEKSRIEFDATGIKNIGDKAKGKLKVSAYFSISTGRKRSVELPIGTEFHQNQSVFLSTKQLKLSWNEDSNTCENTNQAIQLLINGCMISGEVEVEAKEAGTKYNLGPLDSSAWSIKLSDLPRLKIYNQEAFTGGTDKIAVVVQQSDIDRAKKDFVSEGEAASKAKLLSSMPKDSIPIDSSFLATSDQVDSTPKVGQPVEENKKPVLEVKNIYTINYVDKVKAEEFIKLKTSAKITDQQSIYALDTPFIERFIKTDKNITAKLKGSTKIGPKVTEKNILDKAKGLKIGEVAPLIKDIHGVSQVEITKSYFWVGQVPNDPNKITIKLRVE